MKFRLTISNFLLILITVFSSGCGPILVNYSSNTGENNCIPAKAKIDVNCSFMKNYSTNSAYVNRINEEFEKAIMNSIEKDLSSNLFNTSEIGEPEIIVNVSIDQFTKKYYPYGLLWYPLWIVGFPTAIIKCQTNITLTILKADNSLIKTYKGDGRVTGWMGIFSGFESKYYNKVFKITMEDIKSQIINDKEKIMDYIFSDLKKKSSPKYSPNSIQNYPVFSGLKQSIAVMELKSIQVPESIGSAVSDLLRDELFQTNRFKIIDRSEMKLILDEYAFRQSGACDDISCIVEVGKILSVEKMLTGSVSQIGNMYYLTLKMVNVETAEFENIVSAKGPADENELFDIVSSAVYNLISK